MIYFLNIGVPILSVVFYATVAFSVFHRYRRRHLAGCLECKRKIKQNIRNDYRWDDLLCDKYDMGSVAAAVGWPLAWPLFKLYDLTRVETKPVWLREAEMQKRIDALEAELRKQGVNL